MLHVQALQNDLSDDEIYVFLLQFNLFKEFEEKFLRNSTLSITFGSKCSHYLLIICCNEFSNLNEHFFFFFLRHYLVFRHKLCISS